ncbi:MAG: hypothetical protein IJC34_03435, partial [Lentisphaeria bacterium]|nr:hypothetical protein [Lentisphaeria bacterium]
SLRRRRVRISPYKSVQVRIPLPAPCALRKVPCQPSGGSRARQGDSRPLRSGTFAARPHASGLATA